MAKTKKDVKKEFYLSLLKTAIKDKNFLHNTEIFDDLLKQSEIDINENLNTEKNPYLLTYALDNCEKFKYLVQTYHANYKINLNQGDKINYITSLAVDTLKKVYHQEGKYKESQKILDYIKADKYIWLEKDQFQPKKESPLESTSFLILYFSIYANHEEELKNILQFKFTEKEIQKEFEQEKEKFLFILLHASIIANSNAYGLTKYRVKGNKIKYLENYLPILMNDKSFNPNPIEIENLLNLMVNEQHKIGKYKENSLDIVSLMIEHNLYTIEQFQVFKFEEKFIAHFIVYLNKNMREESYIYSYNIFESLLNGLNHLSQMKR